MLVYKFAANTVPCDISTGGEIEVVNSFIDIAVAVHVF